MPGSASGSSGGSVVLQTRGLRKSYGNIIALHGLDLEVHRGEVFGFLGPNGAGKTTFTKLVTGFVRPDSGSVAILGIDAVRNSVETAKHIGLVPDQYEFYPSMSGRQHLEFYGRLQGIPTAARKERIAEVLDIVRMTERADEKVRGYSHGMKQRICIAQAILHKPRLILFDEPTNGLDPQGAYELRELIRGLARDGTTVFLNSHLLSEVEQVCDRVAIVSQGQLRMVGRVDELRRSAGEGVSIKLRAPTQFHIQAAEAFVGARVAVEDVQGGVMLRASIREARIPDLVVALAKAGAKIMEVTPSVASLESVFLEAIGPGAAAESGGATWAVVPQEGTAAAAPTFTLSRSPPSQANPSQSDRSQSNPSQANSPQGKPTRRPKA